MALTIYAVCLVIAVPLLAGAVVCRLLDRGRAMTPEDWIDAPFIGIAALIIPLQNGFYFGLPVGQTAIPWLAVFVVAAVVLIVRRQFGRARDFPVAPYAIAVGAYVVQGIGLFRVGFERYLGRAWGDQFNYVAIAEFVSRYPASAASASGLPPFAIVAGPYTDVRIGQSVLLAFLARVMPADAKVLFEPAILLSVPLVVLAIYAVARAAALPESVSRAASAIAGVLPAVAYIHLESFFSHALALPLLIYVIVLCERAVRMARTGVFIKLALVISALGSVYPEFMPLAFACVLVMAGVGAWRSESRWSWLARSLLVLAAPFALHLSQRLWSRWTNMGQPVLGFLYPWAFSLEGFQRLWLGDPAGMGSWHDAIGLRVFALAVTIIGYAGLLLNLVARIAPRARGPVDEGAPRLVLALSLFGVAAAPLLIAARDFEHGYQFYKLMLTITPLLVVGIAMVVHMATGRWRCGPVVAWSAGILAFTLGVPAAWGTFAMGLESASPPADAPRVRDNTFWTLHGAFAHAQRFLESQHGRQIVLCAGDTRGSGGYLNAWLGYFARDNQVWALNPRVNDQQIAALSHGSYLAGFPSPIVPGVLVATNGLGVLWADGSVTSPVWRAGPYRVSQAGDKPFALLCHASIRTDRSTPATAEVSVPPWEGDLAIASNYAGEAFLVAQPADPATRQVMASVEMIVNGRSAASRMIWDSTWTYAFRLRSGLSGLHITQRAARPASDAGVVPPISLTGVRLLLGGDWVEVGRIENPNGLEKVNGADFFWMGGKPTEFDVLVGRAGELELQFEAAPGPSVHGSAARHVHIDVDGKDDSTRTIGTGPVSLRISVPAGRHMLRLTPLDRVNASLAHDPRPLVLGVARLRITLAPQTTGVDARLSRVYEP
jgi:hypothetical protein